MSNCVVGAVMVCDKHTGKGEGSLASAALPREKGGRCGKYLLATSLKELVYHGQDFGEILIVGITIIMVLQIHSDVP